MGFGVSWMRSHNSPSFLTTNYIAEAGLELLVFPSVGITGCTNKYIHYNMIIYEKISLKRSDLPAFCMYVYALLCVLLHSALSLPVLATEPRALQMPSRSPAWKCTFLKSTSDLVHRTACGSLESPSDTPRVVFCLRKLNSC